MSRPKVAVVGAGNVGATAARALMESETCDVSLVDVVDGLAAGKALDLAEAAPLDGLTVAVEGGTDLSLMRDSAAIVVTAGITRKPGMSRDDLLAVNAGIIRDITLAIRTHAPKAFILMVTNPLDVMTYLAWKVSGFPRARVLGMAGVLDSARFACFIARELKVSPRDISAMVLGGHGDMMVPLPRLTCVSGVPVTELLPPGRIDAIVKRTRDAGAEIVSLLKQGSAFYAPGASAAHMVRALLRDEKRLMPAAAILDGEYGEKDVCLGVPAVIGEGGVERVVELKLTEAEKAALRKSAGAVRDGIGVLKERGMA